MIKINAYTFFKKNLTQYFKKKQPNVFVIRMKQLCALLGQFKDKVIYITIGGNKERHNITAFAQYCRVYHHAGTTAPSKVIISTGGNSDRPDAIIMREYYRYSMMMKIMALERVQLYHQIQ